MRMRGERAGLAFDGAPRLEQFEGPDVLGAFGAARRQPVLDIDAGAEPHFDQAVELEGDDGFAHRGPRNAEGLRELALRGQALARSRICRRRSPSRASARSVRTGGGVPAWRRVSVSPQRATRAESGELRLSCPLADWRLVQQARVVRGVLAFGLTTLLRYDLRARGGRVSSPDLRDPRPIWASGFPTAAPGGLGTAGRDRACQKSGS